MRNVPEFLAGVSDYVEADGIGAFIIMASDAHRYDADSRGIRVSL